MSSPDSPSVVVRLRGGLGNQLFQYAAGRSLALRNNAELMLDTRSGFAHDPYGRTYELDSFNIQGAEIRAADEHVFGFSSELASAAFRIREYFQTRIRGRQFDPGLFNATIRRAMLLNTYCQSFRYFDGIRDTLRTDFQFKVPPKGVDPEIVSEILTSNSTCLHARRLHGRTANGSAAPAVARYYGACDTEYYRNALRLITKEHGPIRVFVFSDDLRWAHENMELLGVEGCVIKIVEDSDPVRNFYLMRLCRHFVIANSTFSWWAAWLGDFSEKTVCVPPVWNQGERLFPRDLFPESWTILRGKG